MRAGSFGSSGAPGPATSSAARPINDAIHSTGNYAVWLIVLSLAVTPARRLFNAPKLINMRRTLGVTAFCYAVLHLVALRRSGEVRPRQKS